MSDVASILLKGGPVALIIAVTLAIKYGVEGWQSYRATRNSESAGTMTDAATTNALMLDALRAERAENQANARRITQLEEENARLRDQNFSQRSDYENQIGQLRRQLQDITLQLDGLQARLKAQ